MNSRYSPPAKVAQLIRRFFEANPFEELSMEDMELKFEAPRPTLMKAMGALRKEGFFINCVSVYRKTEGGGK